MKTKCLVVLDIKSNLISGHHFVRENDKVFKCANCETFITTREVKRVTATQEDFRASNKFVKES